MLRTNSAKAKINLYSFIIEHADHDQHAGEAPETDILAWVFNRFRKEKYTEAERRYYANYEFKAFIDWLRGLPSALDVTSVYIHSAVKTLGDILEETKEERERFSESDAERQLEYLIYRTIKEATR